MEMMARYVIWADTRREYRDFVDSFMGTEGSHQARYVRSRCRYRTHPPLYVKSAGLTEEEQDIAMESFLDQPSLVPLGGYDPAASDFDEENRIRNEIKKARKSRRDIRGWYPSKIARS